MLFSRKHHLISLILLNPRMPRGGEELYEGWLTKSPPTKRILRPRWRRRWFALQQTGELPGQFFLAYYTDRNRRKMKGTINLDHCEQVDTGLKFEDNKYKFDFMFDIRTPTRIYYLAADTEEEMKAWVNCICSVCGLKATTEDGDAMISLSNADAVYEEHQVKGQKLIEANSSKNSIDSYPTSPIGSGPYIPISECITGRCSSQGVQDFYTLLELNTKNSYFGSEFTKSHNNDTYDTAPATYLNDIQSVDDPRFYDSPRTLQPKFLQHLKSQNVYNHTRADKNVNCSPLQSPTDSESVFTDDDWPHNISVTDTDEGPLNSSDNIEIIEHMSKMYLDDCAKTLDPPPRPPKPSHVSTSSNYLNLCNSSKSGKETRSGKHTSEVLPIHSKDKSQELQVLNDEMYDFPRSHQLESSESIENELMKRHCYNNAASVEGHIFRYDISPKPTTSASQVFEYDDEDEPTSPVSHSSSSTTAMYSNLPSPLFPSDTQLMPPPTINRSLKPKRKLSDSLSVTSSTEPSSPRPAPSVDRTRKPHIMCQGSSVSVQKPFDSEFDNGRKQRTAHSPTSLDAIRVPDNIYDNHQVWSADEGRKFRGQSDLLSVQYLDLDHSSSQFPLTPLKQHPLRSPGASTVYKQVDFMKTEAFNITRQHLEKERNENPTSYKK